MKEISSIDLYDILGVDKLATHIQIREAFKRLAKLLHPDRSLNNFNNNNDKAITTRASSSLHDTIEQFKNVCSAYTILINPDLRSIYDKEGWVGIEQYNQKADHSLFLPAPNSFTLSSSSSSLPPSHDLSPFTADSEGWDLGPLPVDVNYLSTYKSTYNTNNNTYNTNNTYNKNQRNKYNKSITYSNSVSDNSNKKRKADSDLPDLNSRFKRLKVEESKPILNQSVKKPTQQPSKCGVKRKAGELDYLVDLSELKHSMKRCRIS